MEKFVEGIQPDPAGNVLRHMWDTTKKIGRALGAAVAMPISGALAIPEHALYAGANLLTVPPVLLSKSARIINKTRTEAFNALAGKPDFSMAA